jgi:CheY-like chemotaxis protein
MAKKNVLVVDDSPFVREMVGKIVEQLGHLPTKAEDGEVALRIADHQVPDAIILDVQMPKKDGLAALRELRADERFADTPIVMLTSVKDREIVKRSIQGQATSYILKDDPLEIAKRLKQILEA